MGWTDTSAQRSLVEHVEYRLDQVSAVGATMPVVRAQVYAEAEAAADELLTHVPRRLVLGLAKTALPVTGLALDATAQVPYLRVPLPADFLRFLRARCASWQTPLDAFEEDDSPRYALRLNRFSAPDVSRPAAFLVPHVTPTSKQALELYPAPTQTADLVQFDYVPRTAPETLTGTLRDACVWQAASRVAAITKDYPAADRAAQQALAVLEAVQQGQSVS